MNFTKFLKKPFLQNTSGVLLLQRIANIYKLYCFVPVPSCKRRMDGGLNSVFGELFTNNYGKNKTNFSFAFSSLIIVFSSLVTYNFEQVFPGIISCCIPGLRTYFLLLQLVNAVSFACKQILLFLRSEVTGLPYWS